jgi:glycosyltransferase involved in cell wall biosynthesis
MNSGLKIVYDYRVFDGQLYGGISRYYVKLATYLRRHAGVDVKIVAPLFKNVYLGELSNARDGGSIVRGFKTAFLEKRERYRRVLNRGLTDLYVNLKRPDIYHKTYYDGKWPPRCRSKKVVTIHDMIYERHRDEYEGAEELIDKVARELYSADLVICVSENTKTDLLNYYDVDESKVVVIHHGVERYEEVTRRPYEKRLKKDGRDYILYVGKRDGYKNFKTLVEAWSSSEKLRNDFDIYCFGGGEIRREEREEWRGIGANNDRIVHIAGGDRDLYEAYRNACCFVYPSRYEGFGIPPLEAMACRCPVICADNSSIPEIVGDAGAYFDAESSDDLRGCLEDAVSGEDAREDLTKRGLERAEAFTWKRCAKRTYSEYKRIGCQ